MEHKCKITVLRKECYRDLQEEYLADPNSGVCPMFEVGQEFILERNGERDDFWHMLDGKFCSEAWDVISRYGYTALQGGSIMKGWTNDEKMMIACCNDGTRPVIFKIERMDVEEPALGHLIKVYREPYDQMSVRFRNKIDHDLNYLSNAGIPGLKKIYLFGSCVRGQVRSTSDVDLMILTEDRLTDRVLAADIRWTLDEAIDGVRTGVVFTCEGAESASRIFRKETDGDKKRILEVMQGTQNERL